MLYIFDMGGVITNTFRLKNVLEKINMTRIQFDEICGGKLKDNIFDELSRGKFTNNEFWKIFNERAEKQGFLSVKKDYLRILFHPVLNPLSVKIVQNLKKSGNHRVVCGTNTLQSHYETHLERGDYSFFDQTYASNKIGIIKPDEEFFKIILEAENFKPEETVFTDDRIENIESAKKIGINAFLFESAEKLIEDLKMNDFYFE